VGERVPKAHVSFSQKRHSGERFDQLTFRQLAGSIIGLAFTGSAAIQNVTRTQQRTGSIHRTLDGYIVAFIVAASENNF
jgi:hypothetical protein